MSFPGFRRDPEAEEAAEPLGSSEGRALRALAARVNYLSLDRPDLGFSAKELCRRTASPSTTDWAAL
eukprot:5875356-Alexandrium_andersonii.AAC.1